MLRNAVKSHGSRTSDTPSSYLAHNAQEFALKFLNSEARACYLLTLFQRYGKLMRYKMGKTEGRKYMQYYMPAAQYMKEVLGKDGGGRWIRGPYTFSP